MLLLYVYLGEDSSMKSSLVVEIINCSLNCQGCNFLHMGKLLLSQFINVVKYRWYKYSGIIRVKLVQPKVFKKVAHNKYDVSCVYYFCF